jgi:hypothetical protein
MGAPGEREHDIAGWAGGTAVVWGRRGSQFVGGRQFPTAAPRRGRGVRWRGCGALFEITEADEDGFLAEGDDGFEILLGERQGFLRFGSGVAVGLEFGADDQGGRGLILKRGGQLLQGQHEGVGRGSGRGLSAHATCATHATHSASAAGVGRGAKRSLGVEDLLQFGLNDGPFIVGEDDLLANGVDRSGACEAAARSAASATPAKAAATGTASTTAAETAPTSAAEAATRSAASATPAEAAATGSTAATAAGKGHGDSDGQRRDNRRQTQ